MLSEKTLSHPNLELIVRHEKIHVKEKHTLDILFTEILFLLQWFNPFAWLLKDAVKNNLEYKTDHEIAKNTDAQTYQLAMVSLADKQGVAPFLTALNGSQLKNRIVMMKKKTENKYALVKQLVVLPLLAILVMGLSNKEVKTEMLPSSANESVQPVYTGKEYSIIKDDQFNVGGKVTNEAKEPISGVSIIVKGQTTGTISDEDGNYQIKLDNENETLVFIMPGYLKREVNVEGREQINVLLFKDKNATSGSVKIRKSENKFAENQNSVKIRDRESDKHPLYVVDGIETDNIEAINPEDIQSINVIKGEAATKLYGEKGKNGVVQITTKTNANAFPAKIPGNPLVIVDGQEFDSMEDANLKNDEIANISVLKNESATKIYGEKGKNGVILIATKNAKTLQKGELPVVLNGKMTELTLNEVDRDLIKNVERIDPEEAVKKYGERGKNGVFEITSRNVYTDKVEVQSSDEITTPLELRKFIAKQIKYPLEARQANAEGIVQIFAKVNEDGIVTGVSENGPDNSLLLDEVVAVAYKNTDDVNIKSEGNEPSEQFKAEVKRIIKLLPKIEIPEMQGKTLGFTVKFLLQE